MKKRIIRVFGVYLLIMCVLFCSACSKAHEHSLGYYSGKEPEIDKDGLPWSYGGWINSYFTDLHEEDGKVFGTFEFIGPTMSDIVTDENAKDYMEIDLESHISVLEKDHYTIGKLTITCKDRDYSITYNGDTGEYIYDGFPDENEPVQNDTEADEVVQNETDVNEAVQNEPGTDTYWETDVTEIKNYGSDNLNVGDYITFGHYEQDGNESNGKEEIKWQVLKVESGRVLVASKYALDCKKYNDIRRGVSWETCTLRQWLNDDFINAAFTAEELSHILETVVDNQQFVTKYNPTPRNDTNDRVFCLSAIEIEEMVNYSYYLIGKNIGYYPDLIISPTPYAVNNGAYDYTITEEDYNSRLKSYGYTTDVIGRHGTWWWLRSGGGTDTNLVDYYGITGIEYKDFLDREDVAVRPVMYLEY